MKRSGPVSGSFRPAPPRLCSVLVQNRQRALPIDNRLLRRIIRSFLLEFLGLAQFEVSVQLVGRAEITRLNETFLRHRGPTDVIAFDYREPQGVGPMHGEICVCASVAVVQARRFHTSWQAELVRYTVHGLLHLHGHDDSVPQARRRMKIVEDKALKHLASAFYLPKLGGHSSLSTGHA